MDIASRTHQALNAAIAHLLRPVFRVLLRQSMSFVAFEELAKRVYVEVAMNDFAIEGKKPSISRASILSGLTRKEVQRLLAEPADREGDSGERYNRAARVLTGWTRDTEFLDNKAGNYGYAVFGRVDSGMEVVDAIAAVKTGNKGRYQDVPTETVTIESARRVD